MSTGKRVEAIDVFRGMAVLGFIIWHAFDLFYKGNEYKSPLFRATILTRVSFVMISAMVLGLKSWENYKVRDHFRRSIKIMMYPILVGVIKTIALRTPKPFTEILIYPLYGTGNFTFSILIAIGCVYLFLPLILRYKWIKVGSLFGAITMMVLELIKIIELSEFWQLMSVSVAFAVTGKSILRYSESHSYFKQICLLLLNLGLFSILIIDEDIYWTIRNFTLLQLLLLMAAFLGLTYNVSLIGGKLFLNQLFLFLGNNSFLIYIGHYVLYVIVGLFIGFHDSSVVELAFMAAITVGIFLTLNRFCKSQIVYINRHLF